MLLILDNCEHILDDVADMVDQLLVAGTELTVLATSRAPLDVDGERVQTLRPLRVPTPGSTGSPAAQLFLERLRAANPAAAEGADPGLVERICRDVDGLPLAIELAAALARTYSLEEIAEQTSSDPGALARVGREHPDHHDSVRQAIERSYLSLDTTMSELHRRISVLPGPFTPQLAASLAHSERGITQHGLAELAHRSMLVALGPRGPGRPSRFTQLATVRSHGLQALRRREELTEVRGRMLDWAADLVARKPRVGTSAETGWFAEIDDNLAALRAMLQDALVEQPDPIGSALTHRLSLFWYYRAMLIEATRWMELGTRSPAATPVDRWLSHLALAGQLSMQTRLDLAAPHFEIALAAPPPLTADQVVYVCEIFAVACQAAWNAGGTDTVSALAARIRGWADQQDDPVLLMFAKTSELMDASSRTPPDAVLEQMAETYPEVTALTNRFAAVSYAAMGVGAALAAGRPDDAVMWAERMLNHHRQLGLGDTSMLMELEANALAVAGRSYEAIAQYAAAESRSKRAGIRYPIRAVSADLAALAAARLSEGEREQARREGTQTAQADISAAPSELTLTQPA